MNYKQLWLLAMVIVGGLAVSVLLYRTLSKHEYQTAEAEFRLSAEKKVEAVKLALNDELGIIKLITSYYAGSYFIDRKEFKTFVGPLFERHPDIKLLAWLSRVDASRRQEHEEFGKKKGLDQYHIKEHGENGLKPAAERDAYFPLVFIQPLNKNDSYIGFDLGSVPQWSVILNRAEASKAPIIAYTNISELNPDSSPVICILDHTYNETADANDEPDATPAYYGLILGIFDMREAVKEALSLLRPMGVDLYVFDVSTPDKPYPIFYFPSRIRNTPLPVIESPPPESATAIEYVSQFPMADRTWLAYCVPTDVYFSGKTNWAPLVALLTGFLITGLLAGYLFLLGGRTRRIEKHVSEQTQELRVGEQRFRILVENAADGFFLHDDKGYIHDVNQRACEQLGYSRKELLKMHVFDFEVAFKPEDHHELTWVQPASAYPLTVHGTHRRKDGSTYPAEIHINCLDTGGKRLIMAVVRDVTERKQAEEALRKEQQFLRHLIDLQERDRKLMSYEIHDGLAQHLTASVFKIQGLGIALEKQDLEMCQELLDETLHLMRESVDEARRLISGLRPPILDESGIVAAIEYLIFDRHQNTEPKVEFVQDIQFHRLTPLLEVALFRIAQECLTNAIRYSKSQNIRIELVQLQNSVRLTIQDWGVGFDQQEVTGDSFGLRGIRDRVRLLGGTVDISSTPGKGTTVAVEIPLTESDIDRDAE
jgi:PAS domain S-box-containing protein